MDIRSYKALSQVIVHDTLSIVKQLQKELAKEKRAHKLSAHKHESLLEMIDQDFHEEVGPVRFCAGCGSALNIRYGDFPTIFTFKRNKAGVLRIEGLGVCHDCDYENLSSKVKRSIWLDPIYLPSNVFERIIQDEGTQDDLNIAAAFIIQHAFRRECDWRNPRDWGGTGDWIPNPG